MCQTLLEAGDTAVNKSEKVYTSRTYLVMGSEVLFSFEKCTLFPLACFAMFNLTSFIEHLILVQIWLPGVC